MPPSLLNGIHSDISPCMLVCPLVGQSLKSRRLFITFFKSFAQKLTHYNGTIVRKRDFLKVKLVRYFSSFLPFSSGAAHTDYAFFILTGLSIQDFEVFLVPN